MIRSRSGIAVFLAGLALAFAAVSAAFAQPLSTPAAAFAGRDAAKVRRDLDRRLTDLARRDLFSGVVLVAKGDKVMFQGAYGLASREYGVANRVDTRFNLASASKMFTATAVLALVEQGRVGLDDPVGKYLDASWLAPDIAAKVRIRHLLSHTGGLTDYFGPKFRDASRLRFRDVDDFKPLVADSKLQFEPGTGWRYSNTGFLLLGAVIEKVTGESYSDAVRRLVFEPAGMTSTGALDLEEVNTGYAQGYAKDPLVPPTPPPGVAAAPREGPQPERRDWRERALDGLKRAEAYPVGTYRLRNNIFRHVVKGGPGGGMVSTAPDLLRFANALTSGRLLKPETVAQMTSPKPPAAPGWGYGMMISGGGFGHSGSTAGVATVVMMFPDGWRAIVLSNLDSGSSVGYAALIQAGEKP